MEPEQNLTARDILLELRTDVKAVMLAQGILGERVDNVIKTQHEVKQALDTKDEGLEKRVKVVEDWKSKVMGMLVVIGAGVGFAASLAKDALAAAFHWGN